MNTICAWAHTHTNRDICVYNKYMCNTFIARAIPLVLIPMLPKGASLGKDLVQSDENAQGISNVLKHSLIYIKCTCTCIIDTYVVQIMCIICVHTHLAILYVCMIGACVRSYVVIVQLLRLKL